MTRHDIRAGDRELFFGARSYSGAQEAVKKIFGGHKEIQFISFKKESNRDLVWDLSREVDSSGVLGIRS